MKDDPRVTPVGRIIRKIRFDELPQLFNVLQRRDVDCRAQAGAAGVRQDARRKDSRFTGSVMRSVRGLPVGRRSITSMATPLEDSVTKLEYDLYYIKNMSWSLDSYIIFHTA